MENWKTIPFEENYEVSDLGNIRNRITKVLKSLRYDRSGYLRVTLYPSGKTYSIHRLVGRVWLSDSFEESLQIDHLNAVRDDNRVCNLEWVTQKENARRIKNRHDVSGENNPMSTITEDVALMIKYSFDKTIKEVSEEFNVPRGLVEHIRRRERWKHVVDPEKESKFLSGELDYPREKTANLRKSVREALILDIIEGKLSNKELQKKYGISKSSVCRTKKLYLSKV